MPKQFKQSPLLMVGKIVITTKYMIITEDITIEKALARTLTYIYMMSANTQHYKMQLCMYINYNISSQVQVAKSGKLAMYANTVLYRSKSLLN